MNRLPRASLLYTVRQWESEPKTSCPQCLGCWGIPPFTIKKITAFLRYSLHTQNFTHLQVINQCLSVSSRSCATLITIVSEHFLHHRVQPHTHEHSLSIPLVVLKLIFPPAICLATENDFAFLDQISVENLINPCFSTWVFLLGACPTLSSRTPRSAKSLGQQPYSSHPVTGFTGSCLLGPPLRGTGIHHKLY